MINSGKNMINRILSNVLSNMLTPVSVKCLYHNHLEDYKNNL
jgi:hypothetical protein